MDAITAIEQRRSIRQFSSKPVPQEILERLVTLGRRAPTGLNKQECNFYATTNRALIAQICEPIQANFGGTLAFLPKFKELYGVSEAVSYDAPAIIAITTTKQDGPLSFNQFDAGAACQNILVACEALGLGAVPVGCVVVDAPRVMQILGADADKEELTILIPIGYPLEGHRDKFVQEKPLTSKVTFL